MWKLACIIRFGTFPFGPTQSRLMLIPNCLQGSWLGHGLKPTPKDFVYVSIRINPAQPDMDLMCWPNPPQPQTHIWQSRFNYTH